MTICKKTPACEVVLYWLSKSSVDALVAFSQLVAEVSTPGEVLPLLSDAAVESMGADGAAIFQIANDTAELKLVAARNIPPSISEVKTEVGVIGADLTNALLKQCGGEYSHAHPFPLVSNTDLFGVAVLFFKSRTVLSEGQLALLDALMHLAAIALCKVDQVSKLRQAYKELQASQEILAQTEKLRALGQMSASITHDLKNLLTPLVMQVAMLKRLTDPSTASMKIIDIMEQSLKRGIDTTERLRDFSRQSPDEQDGEDADLNTLVYEAVDLSKPRIRTGISLKLELAESLPQVHIGASDFVSAIVNLLFNAVDAMNGSGEIMIQSGVSGAGAWVCVSDKGPGMPDGVKAKIFEPFFTTKGKEGTGLGLSMVYAFVRRHHGRISVDTAPGKGASFTLWFPFAEDHRARKLH